jgi:hypothetical protein
MMLLGLLGLGIPVVIHLINRRRMKPQVLATLRFLDPQDVTNAFAPVPRDWIQLLLRLLLLSIFVLLMARLTKPSAEVGPRTVALVLDNSMSMRRFCPDGKTTLFESHRGRILQLVRGMRTGDCFSFTLVGDNVFASTGFTSDRTSLEQAVTNAWVSDGGGRCLYTTVEENLRELRSRRALNMALLVFSDQQAQNYRAQFDQPALAPLLDGTSIQPVFVLDPVTNGANAEMCSAEFQPARTYPGSGSKVSATFQNGSDTQMAVTVSLYNGLSLVESRACNVASGETVQAEMRNIFDSPVDTAWKVSLSEDAFNADNDQYTTVRMLKTREVLLVTGPRYPVPEGAVIGDTGADLLACAINPVQAMGLEDSGANIRVTRVGFSALERKALSLYTTVILYGVQELPSAEMVQDLEMYARNGGGLYLIPDASNNPSLFNETFAKVLDGFRLGGLREPKSPAALDTREKSLTDPLLVSLLRGEWGTVNDIFVSRYFDATQLGKARPALKTADGDTLLAMVTLGKGHVCVQTHSWSIQETTMPRALPFVSVVHALLGRLAVPEGEVSDGRMDHMRVGDYHRLVLPLDFRGSSNVVVQGPRRYAFDMPADAAVVTLKDMFVAGAYRVAHTSPTKVVKDRWVAVNRAQGESGQVVMSTEQLSKLCGGKGNVALPSDRLDGLFQPRRELFPWLLLLLFLALTAETLGSVFLRRKKVTHGSTI